MPHTVGNAIYLQDMMTTHIRLMKQPFWKITGAVIHRKWNKHQSSSTASIEVAETRAGIVAAQALSENNLLAPRDLSQSKRVNV